MAFLLSRCSIILTALFWALLSHRAHAWGRLGHRTVSYLAEKFLTEEGATYAENLLDGKDISDASLYADECRSKPICRFTKAWHYINAKDDPPASCGVKYNRDCPPKEGCIISAIVNMTSRVNDPDLPLREQRDAFKFLLHFIGDIHQPLHTEAEERGGTQLDVRFDGDRTNLHAVWDTKIPDKLRGGDAGGNDEEKEQAREWADELFQQNAMAGTRAHRLLPRCQVEDYCTDVTRSEDCALVWAGDANCYICQYVLKDDVDGVEDQELGGEYYDGAVPIVEKLIAMAGYRMGEWINSLAAQQQQQQGAVRRGGATPAQSFLEGGLEL